MTQPTIAQLHNLTDRAGAGLTADEQQRLRDGIDQLHERAETADEAARRALAQRQEMAEERYAWQERGDRAETALAEARRLHAQTCLLAQGVARPPAFTCSLCTALTAPAWEIT